MKLSTGLGILGTKNLDRKISKKILLANTSGKINQKTREKAVGISNDPLYQSDSDTNILFNPDIRYRNFMAFSPLTNINYRNNLLIFACNREIKKAVKIMSNEVVVMDTDQTKYPVFPDINTTQIDPDKQEVAIAILEYLNGVFWPELWQMLKFKKDGLNKMVREFLITGKVAWEIIYDNLTAPKDIIGLQPIDASTLQKFKKDDIVYYVQKATMDNRDRILHENQVILLEWNEYDYDYISYVDGLRMSFNIMRSMQTSKILWFATKSQVRMHINLAMADVARDEAMQRLSTMRNNYTNSFTFNEDGQVLFNSTPNNSGYREFFTAETSASGKPEIEEINANGPDLTEVDSLQYFERLFWNDTGIPFDRIDPNSGDTWGFTDVESLKKTEITFAKDIEEIRNMLEDVFIKPVIIQLTLKEVEIGLDLSLLDSIKIKWISYNQYEKLADLELLSKKIELAGSMADFGEIENAQGTSLKLLPIGWISRNVLDFTEEQLSQIKEERIREWVELGYNPDGSTPEEGAEEEIMEDEADIMDDEASMMDDNFEDFEEDHEELEDEETPEDIITHDDDAF
jgi:AAA ATPase containing von Willebrand factor type A (vWA) domain